MAQYRYVFIAEWYDVNSAVLKKFNLIYFYDNTIELYDLKNNKIFLKRIKYPSVKLTDLWIGSVVSIYSKQFKITDYADTFTKDKLQKQVNNTLAMIKPDAYLHIGKIISILQAYGLLSNLKMTRFNNQQAIEFYKEHQGKHFFDNLINFMTSDFVVGIQLVGKDIIPTLRELLGPTDSLKAKEQLPQSIRAFYGTDGTKNACHGSDSQQSAKRQISCFFSTKIKVLFANKTFPILNNCTLCIIKPHIIQKHKLGQIIDMILMAGFQISAMQWVLMDTPISLEFFKPYQGVLPQYSQICNHMASGPCVALELRQENAVQLFRTLCGPHDPSIAKILRPDTIRAKYGVDRVKNAIHCTDLPQDGRLQVNYIFNIINES